MRRYVMYAIDISSFGSFLHSFWMLVQGAFHLDPAVFRAVRDSWEANWLILVLLFLAGISCTLGQSVVLLVNRVTPTRFILSLLLDGLIFIASVITEITTVLLLVRYVFHIPVSFPGIARTIGLGYAPQLLGFLVLLPYMGSFLGRALDIWSLLAIMVAVSVVSGLSFWPVLLCTLGGWLFFELVKFTIGRPLVKLISRIQNSTAGVASGIKMRDLPEAISRGISDRR